MRTNAAREAMALRDAITSDVGGDPSAAEAVLIEQTACLAALLSDYGRRSLAGALAPDEVGAWMSAINVYRRNGDTLGWKRVAKTVSVKDYLAKRASVRPPEGDTEAM
jgi:hypothetical protein